MRRDILYKFFEGKASPKEQRLIGQWLDESEKHKEVLVRERMVFDAMIVSGGITDRQSVQSRKKRTRVVFMELLRVAAVILVMFLVGGYIYVRKMEEIRLANNIVTVPVGQRVNLQLPDGTSVWLNASSEIIYPAYFSGSTREIHLNGEAYFEVEHNASKPFIVHTETFDIKVLGTKFNVEAYKGMEGFTTALMEGSVEVTDRKNKDKSVRLYPAQKVAFRNGELCKSPIDNYDVYRWREGLICFKETRFADLMRQLEKNYGVRILIDNEAVKEKVFSGKFRTTDGIDNALRLLQKEGHYTFEWDENKTTVCIN
ncbi:MAG: FecR family protein [Parabacteroides distasonis]